MIIVFVINISKHLTIIRYYFIFWNILKKKLNGKQNGVRFVALFHFRIIFNLLDLVLLKPHFRVIFHFFVFILTRLVYVLHIERLDWMMIFVCMHIICKISNFAHLCVNHLLQTKFFLRVSIKIKCYLNHNCNELQLRKSMWTHIAVSGELLRFHFYPGSQLNINWN